MESPTDSGHSGSSFDPPPDSERWRRVVDLLPDAVLFLDEHHLIRSWNQAARHLFGYSEMEALGQNLEDLLPEVEQRGATTRRKAKDGQTIACTLARSTLTGQGGEREGTLVVLRPEGLIEQLAQQSLQARHLVRLNEIAAQVAHEIRNPLAGIHGALQVLRRRLKPGPEELAVFDDIALEIHRLDHLVTDLRRFSRPTSTNLQQVDLRNWLESELPIIVAAKGAELDLRFDRHATLQVRIDTVLMHEVMQNLIGNAVDAQTENPRVRIRLSADGPNAILECQDFGTGVPDDIRKRIMDPFFTTKARGSGLGLALCRRHVEDLGGSLELLTPPETVDPAEPTGAHFLITLPQA